MYSNEDLERFYFQYQTESKPSGESIQSFCKRNNVPYNIFFKWYKDTRGRMVKVSVDGLPPVAVDSESAPAPEVSGSTQVPQASPLRILVELTMSNGLRISRKNLSYRELLSFIEKLEVLC